MRKRAHNQKKKFKRPLIKVYVPLHQPTKRVSQALFWAYLHVMYKILIMPCGEMWYLAF